MPKLSLDHMLIILVGSMILGVMTLEFAWR